MKLLKNSLHIRGDSLYCPLAFSLDSYGNCFTDCVHCYLRRLNEVWGKDLKPMDIEHFKRTLHNGLLNEHPKSPLAWAIRQKKTLRFGNKADPFQLAEKSYRVSLTALKILKNLQWPTVIETKFTDILMDYYDTIVQMKDFLHVMPIISPGWNLDWEKFEKEIPTDPLTRVIQLKYFKEAGIKVGVNGEPFIPGYHTEEDFERTIRILKDHGIPSYNTYNLHFNPFVAKRLHAAGLDIEKIWYYNQDEQWRPILQKLINIAKKYDIILGCPDFVNSGWGFVERSNTCCGVNVDNPCTWNVMTWKRWIQELGGLENKWLYMPYSAHFVKEILDPSWDGIGNYQEGIGLLSEQKKDMYGLKDIK